MEAVDGGRWFAFLPWLAGRPQLKVQVTLIGDQLESYEPQSSGTFLTGASLNRLNRTKEGGYVASLPTAHVFSGTLGQWRSHTGGVADCFILFAPGFEEHWESWLAPGELLEIMRDGHPIGMFPYTLMDGLVDQQMLKICGIDVKLQELNPNPWCLRDDPVDHLGGFAQVSWELVAHTTPREPMVDYAALQDFEEAQDWVREDFMELGDVGIQRLGTRVAVQRDDGSSDWMFLLPGHAAVLESTGQAGKYHNNLFTPNDPEVLVPEDALQRLREAANPLSRMIEAVRIDWDYIRDGLNKAGQQDASG